MGIPFIIRTIDLWTAVFHNFLGLEDRPKFFPLSKNFTFVTPTFLTRTSIKSTDIMKICKALQFSRELITYRCDMKELSCLTLRLLINNFTQHLNIPLPLTSSCCQITSVFCKDSYKHPGKAEYNFKYFQRLAMPNKQTNKMKHGVVHPKIYQLKEVK